jgi:pimeloyl-ACP methyl ester carboxylesterase
MSAAFASIRQIEAGDLEVGYAEAGPASGPAVLLLHGWPYDISSFAESAGMLASTGHRVIVPHLRGFGSTRFLDDSAPRNGQQAALAFDAVALLDALGIERAVLGGFDWGARTAAAVAALWPERVRGLVSVSGYLIGSPEANRAPLAPEAEYAWWYQYYFATERGREGYDRNRAEFARLIWRLASPEWQFDDATFERAAASFDNPDHVDIVIHNYRWRLGLADGERRYDDAERRLAALPPVAVPTITLEGDANGAPHPAPEAYRARFTGRYEHRVATGGIGHDLPQEAPDAFTAAVLDVSH